jgi:hypothetical protein
MSNALTNATETAPSQWFRSTQVTKPSKVGPEQCNRCGGAGGFKGWPGYTCFRCGGNGIDPTWRSWVFPVNWTDSQCAEFDDKRIAKNARSKDRRNAREKAAREAATADFLEALTPEDRAGLQTIFDLPYEDRHEIANDIVRKLKQYGSISQAQVDLALKVQAELAEAIVAKADEPELPELVEGRREITGLVISTKAKESQFGTQFKMLVEEDDGNRVYGTIPSSIDGVVWDTRRTVRVTFTAEVTVSGDDDHFGWYRRPTKATAEEIETGEETE